MSTNQGSAQHSAPARLSKPRSLFAPGQRMRMNVVPMFLNLFVPWGLFVFCCGITAFWVMYKAPYLVWSVIGLLFVLWLVTAVKAWWARETDPNPTWYTYTSFIVLVALIAGTVTGLSIYNAFTKKYYQVMDLKVGTDVDPALVPGQQMMDTGIFNFVAGATFDELRGWHFKSHSLYCVAPIISNTTAIPVDQTYDFWAVGTDCCSLSSSDFRCGAWGSAQAKSGIRATVQSDVEYYRLAVQQAESLYGFQAPNPIFVIWSQDPMMEVLSWNQQAFKNFMVASAFSFVTFAFGMSMASCRYAWLGRGDSAYLTEFYSDASWLLGGVKTMNYQAQRSMQMQP